jgi:hypothetical protein
MLAIDLGNAGMGYAAVALAAVGFVAGLIIGLRTLLLILGLLLLISVCFAISCGFSFLDAVLTVMGAQTIVQGCYFLGLIARAVFGTNRAGHML